jgi:hypothetical protein
MTSLADFLMRNKLDALGDKPEYTTADVNSLMPQQPSWDAPSWLKSIGSHELAQQEPNLLGRLLSYSPEAMTALSFAARRPIGSDPVPPSFRGRAPESPAQRGFRDDTGAWFIEGDKPVYANSSRSGLDALFGPEYAKRFDSYRRFDIPDADRNPHSYWLKPELTPEQAKAFNELARAKAAFSPTKATDDAWEQMHRLQGRAFGYDPAAVDAYLSAAHRGRK